MKDFRSWSSIYKSMISNLKMNEYSHTQNMSMQSGDIIKMLDDVQNTLEECRRNFYKIVESDNTARPHVEGSIQNNWTPNQFQQTSSDQNQTKHYVPTGEIGKSTNQFVEKGGYASGSGNGYSTEEDGIVSMNTDWSSRYCNNEQHTTSDSDINSMIVEFSEDEGVMQDLPKNPLSQGFTDRSPVKDPNRKTQKRTIQSPQKMNTSLNSSPETQRRACKSKFQQHQAESKDSESASNNYCQQNNHSFIQNQDQSGIHSIKAPRLSNPNLVTGTPSGPDHSQYHLEIPISCLAVNSNHEQFLYKIVHSNQLPMYNNIPILPAAVRPSIWPMVAPIYIPTNQQVFLALDQSHQYPQQPSASSSPKITSYRPSPTAGTSTDAGAGVNELSWLRKELINPPTKTGPDGQLIKIKTKRPPLPDWVKAAAENFQMGQVHYKTAYMISKERLYRKIVEETYEYQRLQESMGTK